jgi:hypothetical protein
MAIPLISDGFATGYNMSENNQENRQSLGQIQFLESLLAHLLLFGLSAAP